MTRMSESSQLQSALTDGTLTGCVVSVDPGRFGPAGGSLRLALPISLPATPAVGHYVLARCCDADFFARQQSWSIYARRPLFVAGPPQRAEEDGMTTWELLLPDHRSDPGLRWLQGLAPGRSLNVIGPLGRQYAFAGSQRALIVLADTPSLPLMLPAIHHMLDRGGRVVLIWSVESTAPPELLASIPIQVEVHRATGTDGWMTPLVDTLRWGDCLLAALQPPNNPNQTPQAYHTLAYLLRTHRFRIEPGYAHVLMPADSVCGYGACLACVVPTAKDGFTRACLHGPLFPLEDIAT